MSILVVTRADDNAGVAEVCRQIERRGGSAVRLNTDLYPQEVQISTQVGLQGCQRHMRANGRDHDLSHVTALWYRRFFAGGRLPMELGDLRTPSVEEARRTLYGTLAALGCFQLDPLVCVRRADHKELQLRVAQQLGLTVPKTLFSNDAGHIRSFAEVCDGRIITKMQNSFAVWREGKELVVFTNPMSDQDLRDLKGLEYCPMTFQQWIPKRLELRATVVGRRVFTASVDSQKWQQTQVDWRRDGVGLMPYWDPYQLDPATEHALLRLVEAFGLNYAAADFVVTPEGQTYFLEINAGGEWYWLQQTPGLPIAEALAEVLLGMVERTRVPSAATLP